MTANAGYHAYATGDVLTAAQVQYNLQNQTTMYFASSAARTTALSGVLVEGMVSYIPANGIEYYNGSAWVSVSQAVTALTTKGDLLTYSTQDTRLPVGSDGQTLVAESTQTTGLSWKTPVASLGNPIINGGMDIFQRSSSPTTGVAGSTTAFSLDRWQSYRSVAGSTFSRQATNDTTNLPNIQYCARVQRDSGNSATTSIILDQSIETTNSIPYSGKPVTFSFYARAGANFTATGSNIEFQLRSGTGTDQNDITGFTGAASVGLINPTLTTTWQRFIVNGTVASTATQLAIRMTYIPTATTAGAADYFEVTGVQIDLGTYTNTSVPVFRRSGNTIQGELAACQRYYWRENWDAQTTYAIFGQGSATSTTVAYCQTPYPVQMRVKPTAIDFPAVGTYFQCLDAAAGGATMTALSFDANQTTSSMGFLTATVAAGLTQYRPYVIRGLNSTAAYLGWSAEL